MRIPIIVLAIALPGLAGADTAPRMPLVLLETGVFCPYEVGERIPAPDTQLGYIHRGPVDPVQVSDGTHVPARLGMAFGIRMHTAPDVAPVPVSVTVTRPNGLTDRWTTTIGPNPGASRFKFEFPEEIVPGTWAFTIESGGEVLATRGFVVVPDWMLPDIVAACFGLDTLS